jgi:hypothetical protein
MRARTVIMGGLAALALSGCAWQGNAATPPPPPTPHDGGTFLPFYVQQLTSPPADNICQPQTAEQLLMPCDKP